MNKTVTINISGIIFHIEEDAYEVLNKYLSDIKTYFVNTDGGAEIMSDIEARIAEMLQSKTSASKQVVLMSDVTDVIANMGKPEEFGGEEPKAEQQQSYSSSTSHTFYNESIPKRLFRDGDSKVLGGVCSGVANYFGIDVVWLRIALLILFFFAGTGILIYIILWMAIPEAKTTAEKLAMKGEKADINTISKAVKEEAEQLKKRMEKYGENFSNMSNSNNHLPRTVAEKFIDFLSDLLLYIGRTLLKIVGVLMIIFGIIFFLGLFSSVFGLSIIGTGNGGDWIDMLLLDGKDFYIGIIGIVLFFGIPIIMMIYGGVKLLFKIYYHNRWLNLSSGIIWLIGFTLLLFVGIKTGSDFNKTAKVRENVAINPYETLYVKMSKMPINSFEIAGIEEYDDYNTDLNIGEKIKRKFKNKITIGYYKNDRCLLGKRNDSVYLLGHAQLSIIKSQTDKFELVIIKEAKGGDKFMATQRAKHINYKVVQTDSILQLDDLFEVMNADKFRVQDVTVILKVPVGKTIYLDASLEDLMYDIENVTNTYDGDMINRRWTMSENGLKCLDCDGIISNTSNDESEVKSFDKNEDVKITINGVHIKAKDANIKMDSNGVNINSKEAKVIIDKNGINVETKK